MGTSGFPCQRAAAAEAGYYAIFHITMDADIPLALGLAAHGAGFSIAKGTAGNRIQYIMLQFKLIFVFHMLSPTTHYFIILFLKRQPMVAAQKMLTIITAVRRLVAPA